MEEKTYRKIKNEDKDNLVTRELCEQMEEFVNERIPLVRFWKENDLERDVYRYFLTNVLQIMFPTEQIKEYFLGVLIKKQSVADTWTIPNKNKFLKYTLGYNYSKTIRGWDLYSIYSYVYDNLFTLDVRYPRAITDEVIRCFTNNLPMPNTYKWFCDLQPENKAAPYRTFIAYMLGRFEDDRVKEYFERVIEDYTEKLKDYRKGYVYIQDIMFHIFGSYFSHAVFCAEVRGKEKKELEKSFRYHMNKILLRAAWPYICMNYVTVHDTAYKAMELTEKEKKEYDEKYFSQKRHNVETLLNYSLADIEKLTFPAGSCFDDVRQWVETYFECEVAPSRIIPTKKQIYKYIRSGNADSPIIQDLRHVIENTLLRRKLSQCIDDTGNRLKEQFLRENEAEIMSDKQHIIVYFTSKEGCAFRIINSTPIKPPILQQEFLMYRREILLVQKGITTKTIQDLNKAIVVLANLSEEYGIKKCADIKKTHILLYLHEMQKKDYAPMTVGATFGIIKSFIKTIQEKKDYEFAPTVNPAKNIHFSSTRAFVKNRPVIPEDILAFIDDNLWEIEEDVRLMYMLMRVTLWRFGDIANLRVGGISKADDEGYATIRTKTGKTKAALRKHHCDDTIEDVIPYEIYIQLLDYIEATAVSRETFGTDLVFFQGRNNQARAVSASRVNDAVNELLERHGIRSIDETYKGFSTSQTRATGAVFLIEADEALPIVQKKLMHLSDSTTAKFYARVRKEKLAELDQKYFDEQFSDLLDDKKRALMTEEKRQQLYWGFSTVMVEFGECERPICGEKCQNHGTAECATCPKLITGPEYLRTWQDIKSSSDRRIEELEAAYVEKGIDKEIYDTFSEYQTEKRRNAAYKTVIDRILEYDNKKSD